MRDDDLGRALADRLIASARAGVTVYFLFDDVGSGGLSRAYKRRLEEAGVAVSAFNKRHRWLRLYGATRIQYRNHRKIVVADGKVAWFGGLNAATDYLGRSKKFGPWRDTHLRIEGPAGAGGGADLSGRLALGHRPPYFRHDAGRHRNARQPDAAGDAERARRRRRRGLDHL